MTNVLIKEGKGNEEQDSSYGFHLTWSAKSKITFVGCTVKV